MCCQNFHQYSGPVTMGPLRATCGCGCTGREPPGWHLENYKAYLKAELASVEKQIHAIQNTKP